MNMGIINAVRGDTSVSNIGSMSQEQTCVTSMLMYDLHDCTDLIYAKQVASMLSI